MKVIFIALVSLLSVTYVTCQSGVNCQSLRRFTEEQCDQVASGGCSCDSSEVEELREQYRLLNESFQAVYRGVKQNSRVEICGVGIKDGRVKDKDLTASSFHSDGYQARYARLDKTGSPRSVWHAAPGRHAGEWIQVDLETPTRVVGVVTQGRPNVDQWTTSYKILYGNSIDNLQAIKNNNGADMIFQGNRDRNSHVTNVFPRPITARYFRLVVHTYHVYLVIRMEYLTC